MELGLFDEVSDLVRSMAPDGLGELRCRAHRRGVKVWFGPEKPIKEHYEAQLLRDGTIEVGFHSEQRDPAENEAVLAHLVTSEATWRPELGDAAVAGPFLGQDAWRRISEVWTDVELEVDPDPDLGFELASRLIDYIELLEPIRQSR